MIQTAGGTATNNVNRSWGNFPDNTGDWTVFIRFKWSTTPASYISLLNLFQGTPNFTGPYIFLGSLAATDNLVLETLSGDTSTFAITHNTQYWAAITYKESTHTLTLIVSGTTVGTLVTDLSAVVWDKFYLLGDGGLSPANAASVAYCRAWSRILMASELTTESTSITAASQTSLIWDNPLQTSVDLTAHNNTLNQLVATGTVTTDTSDPLLSVITGPPTNTTPATALTITADSAIFQDVVSGGATVAVWVKYTPASTVKVLSYIATAFSGETYTPAMQVALNLTQANLNSFENGTNTERAGIFPNTQSQPNTYYFRINPFGGIPAVGHAIISVIENLDLPVPAGSYAVNDDGQAATNNTTYPLAYLDRDTGYPINWINNFYEGEIGETLALSVNKRSLFSNGCFDFVPPGDNKVYLVDISYATITSTDLTPLSGGETPKCGASNRLDKFLVGQVWENQLGTKIVRLWIIDDTCTVLNHFDISGQNFICAIGVAVNFTIGYAAFSDAFNIPIKRIDLSTGAILTDLAAGDATHGCGRDILCIDSNNILVPYYNNTDLLVKKYKDDGTLVATFNYNTLNAGSPDALDVRLAWKDATTFILWAKGPAARGKSTIIEANVSDGAITHQTPTYEIFSSGDYQGAIETTPQRFASSESCPILRVLSSSTPANPGGGIYLLTGTSTPNPRINHDVIWVDSGAGTTQNVAIPNPTFESYLAGDE